jgi:predicted nucleotidyltransferase
MDLNKKLKDIPADYRKDIQKAVEILKKAGIKEIYLFGSFAKKEYNENSDIDIAVVGLNPKKYYRIYGELMMNLDHDIDLIKLDDKNSRFSKFIKEEEELLKIA